MKVRTGFVSNSSSSSYIIGIAKVPPDKVSAIKSHNVLKLGESKYGGLDLPEPLQYRLRLDGTYEVWIESFTGIRVCIEASIGDWIEWLDSYGPDGDESFWNGYEYDYDVDLGDFSPHDCEVFNEILALGGEATCGAGRDG